MIEFTLTNLLIALGLVAAGFIIHHVLSKDKEKKE